MISTHKSYINTNIQFQGLTEALSSSFPSTKNNLSMGRQSCDPTISRSSIALLQERFRQLEKAKETRQQRELLRLLSEAEKANPATSYEPSSLFFHSELVLPTAQPIQGSFSLQSNKQTKRSDFQVNETPDLANVWSADTIVHVTKNIDETDVDTSLHL